MGYKPSFYKYDESQPQTKAIAYMYDQDNNLGGGSLTSTIAVSDSPAMSTPLANKIDSSSHNYINEVVGLRNKMDDDIHYDIWSLTDQNTKD